MRVGKQLSRAGGRRRQKSELEAEWLRGRRSAEVRGFTLSFVLLVHMETFCFYYLQARDLCHHECAVKTIFGGGKGRGGGGSVVTYLENANVSMTCIHGLCPRTCNIVTLVGCMRKCLCVWGGGWRGVKGIEGG